MAGVLWGVNIYYDPPQRSTFHAQAHQGRQALVFQAKVGEQRARLLLDTRTTNCSFITAAICRRLGIPIPVFPFAQEQGQADRLAPSMVVDPTEFSGPPLGTLVPQVNLAIPSQMLTPITSGNGNQGSPMSISTFTLSCQGFRTKVTCSILNLVEELDVVLGHKWCLKHQVVISYKDEHATFVYKHRPQLLHFDDSRAQTHHASSSLCPIHQATRFVQK